MTDKVRSLWLTAGVAVFFLCGISTANALKEGVYERPGMGEHTVNPIVGETNDSRVNNMWADPVQGAQVFEALDNACGGPVEEGSVGARTGTQAFGWKGDIGTSSRVLPESLGGYTVGVLVQTNFGGTLEAILVEGLKRILEKHQVQGWDKSQRP